MRRWLRVFIVGALSLSLPLHTARACHGLGGRCRSRSCWPACCPPSSTGMPVGGWVVVSDVPLAAVETWCLQPACSAEFPTWQPLQCCVPADGSAHAVGVYWSSADDQVFGACETVHPHVVPSGPTDAIVVERGVATESTVIDTTQPATSDATAAAADRTVLPPPTAAEPATPAPRDQAPSDSASGGDVVERPLPLPSGPDNVPAAGPLLPASGEQPVLEPIAAEPPATEPSAAAEKTADEAATATAEPMPPSPAREEPQPAAPVVPAPPVPAAPPVAQQPQPQPAAETPLPEIAEKAPPKAGERNLFDEVAAEEEQAGKPDANEPPAVEDANDDADADAAAEAAEDEATNDTPAATEAADDEAEDDDEEEDDDAADEDEDAADDADEEDDKQKEADPFSAILRTPGEPLRRWTDDTGLHQTIGRLVEVHPDRVRILKANGAHASVPLERLSPVDRAYVFETGARVADGRESPKPAAVDTAGL